MIILEILAVALGGAVGAPLRFAAERAGASVTTSWPVGTFAANMIGSLVAGFSAAFFVYGHNGNWHLLGYALISVGLCGALTTFSSFCLQIIDFAENKPSVAWAYSVGSLVLGLILATIGYQIGSGL